MSLRRASAKKVQCPRLDWCNALIGGSFLRPASLGHPGCHFDDGGHSVLLLNRCSVQGRPSSHRADMEAEIWGAEIWDWNIVDPAEFRSGAKDQRPAMAHEAMAHEAMAHEAMAHEAMAHKRLLLERSPIRLMRQQQTSHNLVEEKRQSLGAIEDSA